MNDYYVIEPCQSANGVEIKLKEKRIDLGKAEEAMMELGSVAAVSRIVLLAKVDAYNISVYGSGRVMIKSQGRIAMDDANALAKRIIAALEEKKAVV